MRSLSQPGAAGLKLSDRTAALLFNCSVALPALSAGVLGVLRDASQPAVATGWVNIHTLFGVFLCFSIIAQFTWQVRHAKLSSTPAIAAYSRHLSREVYLLIYLLAGIKEIQYFVASLPSGSALAKAAPGAAMADIMKDFQCYLAYGCFALVTVRVLAALYNYQLRQQPA
jgi:cytochrome b561